MADNDPKHTSLVCLGCGNDISERRHDRRNFESSDARKRVLNVWEFFMEKKIAELGVTSTDWLEISGDNKFMCRSCFSAFDWYE